MTDQQTFAKNASVSVILFDDIPVDSVTNAMSNFNLSLLKIPSEIRMETRKKNKLISKLSDM